MLVVGGAGFIGSHACKALAQSQCDVTVYDNLTTGHFDAVKWGGIEVGDILDSDHISLALRSLKPDIVLHFAGLAYVGDSIVAPSEYYRNNVVGTLSLLDAMRACNVSKLVFSSSCATYGVPDSLPISEQTPQAPINAYGHTKLAVERVLADYDRAYGLKYVSLRYFNAAGADPEGELGERHDPETHVIPLAIAAALGTGPPFSVFGTDYPTPDGSAVRDYVHVTDLATAHVKAAEHLLQGGDSFAANLGTGKGTSVLEVIETVERLTGRVVTRNILGRRRGDPPVLFARADLAKQALGWQPEFTEIAPIVETALRWYSK